MAPVFLGHVLQWNTSKDVYDASEVSQWPFSLLKVVEI